MKQEAIEPSTSYDLAITGLQDRVCRVCGERSDGAHFGIDSCRACAAFFRRSVVTRKKYVCRQGGNNCEILKSVRCMCRKCRLRKCLEAGMLPESVQSKRDPIVPRRQDPDPLGASGSPSDNELIKNNSQLSAVQSPPILMPEPIPLKPIEAPSMLFKIINNYKQLCFVRKTTEHSMNPPTLASMFTETGPLAGYVMATTTKTSKIYRAHLPAISDFITQTFSEFSDLDQTEKWLTFQAFVVILWGMDCAYRTFKTVPPSDYTRMNIITETTYIDLERVEDFYDDLSASSTISKGDIIKLLKQCMGKPRLKMLFMMNDMQLQDEEYAALLGLMLWNQNSDKATDRMEEMGKKMRARLFEQLHLWYTNNNLTNYAQRLGSLMCLFSSILHYAARFSEDVEIFRLYDLYEEDSFIYDLIKHY